MEKYNTKEKAYEYAKQFKNRTEISIKDYKFYRFIIKSDWIKDIPWLSQKNVKWTYEKTYEEALKYNSKKDFEKHSSGAYSAALKNHWMKDYGWLQKKHMIYTYEFCYNIAKQCNSSKEMSDICQGAYVAAIRQGWKKDYTWFKRKINKTVDKTEKIYFIYAYFDDINKSIYVGLTKTNKRDKQHRRLKDTVNKYFTNANIEIPQWVILENYLTAEEASIKEGEWLNFYIQKGWKPINKAKTGSLGAGNIIWTEEKIINEAKKYGYKYEFCKKNYIFIDEKRI